jgi:TetR/AcrR family transcriptional regulator of autoinduction and epiphytic fitness
MSAASGSPRVDPRIDQSRRLVLRAAIEQLAAAGFGGLTIEAVAGRSGVAKSTIYRHWPDKHALIADAFEAAHHDAVPSIAGLSARDGLEQLLQHVAEVAADPVFSPAIPALIEGAERNARLRDFQQRYSLSRRQSVVELIERGVASGEFAARQNPQLAAQLLIGLIFYQRLMTSEPFDPASAGELIDAVLSR